MYVLIKRTCPENYQKFAYLEMLGCILEDPILIIKFLSLHPCFEYFTLHWENELWYRPNTKLKEKDLTVTAANGGVF